MFASNAQIVECSMNVLTLDAFTDSSMPENTLASARVCYSVTRLQKNCPNAVKWRLHMTDPSDGDPAMEAEFDMFYCDECKEFWQQLWRSEWFPV